MNWEEILNQPPEIRLVRIDQWDRTLELRQLPIDEVAEVMCAADQFDLGNEGDAVRFALGAASRMAFDGEARPLHNPQGRQALRRLNWAEAVEVANAVLELLGFATLSQKKTTAS